MAGTNIEQTATNTPLQPKTVAPITAEEILTLEFKSLDEIMSSKHEFRNILAQIYKIMTLLHRMGSRDDKTYALDKELEMTVQIKVVKDSYNSWPVLVITCISGSLTIGGGVFSIFGAFPGTAAGDFLGTLPGIGSFFDVSGAADKTKAASELASKISGFGQGVGSIGQGTGVFSKLFENKDEAARTVEQFWLQQLQRKHEDRNRASQEDSQQAKEAQRKLSQAEDAFHNIATQMTQTRT